MADRKDINRTTEKYKRALGNQVDDLKANAGQIGKNALVITGALVASYLIVRLVIGKDKTKKSDVTKESRHLPVAPLKREFSIVGMIKQQIVLFVLSAIKQQILTLLEKSKTKN